MPKKYIENVYTLHGIVLLDETLFKKYVLVLKMREGEGDIMTNRGGVKD